MKNRRLFYGLGLLALLLAVLEGITRLYLLYVAPPATLLRYASVSQLYARYGEQYTTHRYLAYYPTPRFTAGPNYQNGLGYRGDEIDRNKGIRQFRIVVIGDGFVYGEGVQDYHESFPYLLEQLLHEAGYVDVQVVNGGVPGYTSWEGLLNFEFRALDLAPDLVIVYHGLTDVPTRLVSPPGAYQGDNSGYLANIQAYSPRWWERSMLLRAALVELGAASPNLDPLLFWRPRASSAYDLLFLQQNYLGTYPSGIFAELTPEELLAANPPRYFERNMRNMVIVGQTNEVPLLLLTNVYNAALEPDADIAALYQSGLAEHNRLLEDIAATTDTLLLDLADILPMDAAHFLDSFNLTVQGNQTLAEMLAGFLIDRDLLPAPAP